MKHNLIVVYGLSILLLLGAFSSIVYAGFDPSPFQPEINTLMAVVNELNSIETLLQLALTLPANEIGLINQLETISDKLSRLNYKVQDVREKLAWPPDDQEVSDALFSVQYNTQDIIDIADEFLSAPPDPLTPEFLEALGMVKIEAIFLINQVYHRINLLYPPSIPSIDVPEDVTSFVLHGWVTGGPMGEMPEWPSWNEMTSEQKNEYLDTASFELSIDGVPVELSRFQWYNLESDVMYVAFYTVFPPYTFPEGTTYTFVGFWSVEFNYEQFTYTETRTIIPH